MIVFSCLKKDNDATPEEEVEERMVQVLELESNQPIPGVTMTLKKCTKNDLEFGCLSYSTVKTLRTNDSGKITFSHKLNIEEIEAQHPNYWRVVGTGNQIIMTPLATVRAHVKRIKTYPAATNLSIAAGMADCRNIYCIRYINYQRIGLPADTIVYLNAYGNLDNQVCWHTTETLNSDSLFELPRFRVNRFDTVSVKVAL